MTQAPNIDEDRTARDLLRSKEIVVRPRLAEYTLRRLFGRITRRPVGNSAKLWAKVGEPDPFKMPEDEVKPEHRTVYAAGRFIRVDQVDKEANRNPLPPRAPPKETSPNAPKPAAPAPAIALPPALVRSGSKASDGLLFSSKATNTPPPARGTVPGAVDRTPPLVPVNSAGSISPSGRIRTANGPPRPPEPPRPPTQLTPTAAPPPVTPLSLGGNEAKAPPALANLPAPPKPAPPKPAPKTPATALHPASAPPPSAPTPASVKRGEAPAVGSEIALPPMGAIPGAVNTPGPAQVVPLRKPTRAEPETPPENSDRSRSGAAPAPRAPSSGGLDDLFGGAQEGRVKITPRRKPPTETT